MRDIIQWINRRPFYSGFIVACLSIVAFGILAPEDESDWVPANTAAKVTGYQHKIFKGGRRRRAYLKAEFQIDGDTVLYPVYPKDSTGFGMGDSVYRFGDTLFYVDSEDWFRERRVLRVYR
jgi:hypothetical protein